MPRAGSTTQRGYGSSHQTRRKRLAPQVEAGETTCWRCGLPIRPGQQWDLGHSDHDRSQYRGPEHARAKDCPAGGNRATKGRQQRRHTGALYVVTGPPASGKTTWVQQHARPGDITIDYDALANVLTPPSGHTHTHAPQVQAVTKAARQAAINQALATSGPHSVYIIHSAPSAGAIRQYQTLGAEIVTIDPGIDVVMARCKAERPWQMQRAVKEWYDTQQTLVPGQQTSGRAAALAWFTPTRTA